MVGPGKGAEGERLCQKAAGRDSSRAVSEQFGVVSEFAICDSKRGDVLQDRGQRTDGGPDAKVIGREPTEQHGNPPILCQ